MNNEQYRSAIERDKAEFRLMMLIVGTVSVFYVSLEFFK